MDVGEEATQAVPVAIGCEVDIQSPGPAPLQDDSVLLEGCDRGEMVGTEGSKGERSGERDDVGVPDRLQRFYFESDALVLKNNIDYQKMLKTLALLEAQKIQAMKDLEQLIVMKSRASRNPSDFVAALKNATLEPLPTRQHVVDLPDINWNSYMDSVEKVVKQHSSVYQRTRRKVSSTEATTLTKMESTASSKLKSGGIKPPSYKQPWTAEEQMRLEELLRAHPPEAIERRRYEKIAKALGTRTPQQVASHVQKYFIKLAKAGLPVPGRAPNVAAYTSKSKKGGRLKRLSRPSTFFSTLAPRVFMSSGEGGEASSIGSYSPTPTEEREREVDEEEEEEDEEEEESSDSDDSLLTEWVPTRGQQQHMASTHPTTASIMCVSCQTVVVCGQYWMCCDCPVSHKTVLCPECVNSDYQTSQHSPRHEMVPHTLSSSLPDEDYTQFSLNLNAKYNYLDPNFFPAL